MTSESPSRFEMSFVALPVTQSWETPRGSSRVSRDGPDAHDTATVEIEPPPIPDGKLPGADTPIAVWKSYGKAKECLTVLLVHEAAERVNKGASDHSLVVRNHKRPGKQQWLDVGARNKTCRIKTTLFSSKGEFNLFTLHVQPAGEGSKPPPGKRQKFVVDSPWERGGVVMLSICEASLLLEDVKGGRTTQNFTDSELQSLRVKSEYEPPKFRHGVVISDRKILFAVEARSNLSTVLKDLVTSGLTLGLSVWKTEASVLDLARHSWALETVGNSALANYVADPRLSWQCNSSSQRDALKALYADEVGQYTDILSNKLTPEQMAIPAVLGSRVAVRASSRWKQRECRESGVAKSARLGTRRWSHLDTPLFLCVQGPPGSGKSTTIVGVVNHCLSLVRSTAFTSPDSGFVLRNHPRFLITAPTNYATDELLVRFSGDRKFSRCVTDLSSQARQTNVGRALSSFLECCALIRMGKQSKDQRQEVVERLEDNLLSRAAKSVRTSIQSVEEQIRDVERQVCRVDATLSVLAGVTRKAELYEAGTTENTILIDGVPCTLQGDVPSGLARAKALDAALRKEGEELKQVRDSLDRDKARISAIFRMQNNEVDATYMRMLMFCNAICVFSTCDGAANLKDAPRLAAAAPEAFDAAAFDLVLVDEAARCTIPQLLVPVAVAHQMKRNVLDERGRLFDVCAVGDPAQNAATVSSRHPAVQKVLPKSFLERALDLLRAECDAAKTHNKTPPWTPSFITLLTRQFRMHPFISEFPRNRFYAGKLKDGLAFSNFDRPWHFQSESVNRAIAGGNIIRRSRGGLGPLLFIATDLPSRPAGHRGVPATANSVNVFQAKEFSKSRFQHSRGNIGEALVVVRVLVALAKLLVCDRHDRGAGEFDAQHQHAARRKPSVLILAPYQLQRVFIEELLSIRADTGPGGRLKRTAGANLREIFGGCEGVDFDRLQFPLAAVQVGRSPVVSGPGITSKDSLSFLAEMCSSIPVLHDCFEITVSTVDSSIGREVDIVLLSKVADDSEFLKDDKRMCVGLTRASSLLVVCGQVGDISSMHSEADSWKLFARHCHEKGFLVSVQEVLEYLDIIIADHQHYDRGLLRP